MRFSFALTSSSCLLRQLWRIALTCALSLDRLEQRTDDIAKSPTLLAIGTSHVCPRSCAFSNSISYLVPGY